MAALEQWWRTRRSFDGFTVLVVHTKVEGSAAELCRTYRAKNAFHVSKSVVKLRPVRHRTDLNVRAHIALCMLALHVRREMTQARQGQHLGRARVRATGDVPR
jgi:transposase